MLKVYLEHGNFRILLLYTKFLYVKSREKLENYKFQIKWVGSFNPKLLTTRWIQMKISLTIFRK